MDHVTTSCRRGGTVKARHGHIARRVSVFSRSGSSDTVRTSVFPSSFHLLLVGLIFLLILSEPGQVKGHCLFKAEYFYKNEIKVFTS